MRLFHRRRPATVQDDGPVPQSASRSGAWAALPPLQRTVGVVQTSISHKDFVSDLAAQRSPAAFLAPLTHSIQPQLSSRLLNPSPATPTQRTHAPAKAGAPLARIRSVRWPSPLRLIQRAISEANDPGPTLQRVDEKIPEEESSPADTLDGLLPFGDPPISNTAGPGGMNPFAQSSDPETATVAHPNPPTKMAPSSSPGALDHPTVQRSHDSIQVSSASGRFDKKFPHGLISPSERKGDQDSREISSSPVGFQEPFGQPSTQSGPPSPVRSTQPSLASDRPGQWASKSPEMPNVSSALTPSPNVENKSAPVPDGPFLQRSADTDFSPSPLATVPSSDDTATTLPHSGFGRETQSGEEVPSTQYGRSGATKLGLGSPLTTTPILGQADEIVRDAVPVEMPVQTPTPAASPVLSLISTVQATAGQTSIPVARYPRGVRSPAPQSEVEPGPVIGTSSPLNLTGRPAEPASDRTPLEAPIGSRPAGVNLETELEPLTIVRGDQHNATQAEDSSRPASATLGEVPILMHRGLSPSLQTIQEGELSANQSEHNAAHQASSLPFNRSSSASAKPSRLRVQRHSAAPEALLSQPKRHGTSIGPAAAFGPSVQRSGRPSVEPRQQGPDEVALASGIAHRVPDGSIVFGTLTQAPSTSTSQEPASQAVGQPVQRVNEQIGSEAPPETTVSSGATTIAPASAAPPRAPGDLDDLARRLYPKMRPYLRNELWLDRERAGLLTDSRR